MVHLILYIHVMGGEGGGGLQCTNSSIFLVKYIMSTFFLNKNIWAVLCGNVKTGLNDIT